MNPAEPVTLLLHLDPDSDPIRGRVEALGEVVEFAGWLQLAGALERALSADGQAPSPADVAPGTHP